MSEGLPESVLSPPVRPAGQFAPIIAYESDLAAIYHGHAQGIYRVRSLPSGPPDVNAWQGSRGLVSRVVSDFTVWFRDNEVCLSLRLCSCVPVMSRG